MPINQKLMNSLLGEYGEKGKNIYFAMENKRKMKAKIDAKKKKK